MTVLFIAILGALAIGLCLYGMVPQSSAVSQRLATYGGGVAKNAKHILVFEQAMNADERSTLLRSLQEAGWYTMSPALFKATQAGCLAAGIVAGGFLYFTLDGTMKLLGLALALLGYFVMPARLSSAKKTRKLDVQCVIPELVDSLAIAVGAGVALNQALINASEQLPGPLGSEIKAALADIRMGRARADALNALSQRVNQPDLSSLVTALVQAEKVGGNVSQILGELSKEARDRRFSRAEEKAASLPAKMTVPMVMLLLPSLCLYIAGPVWAGVTWTNTQQEAVAPQGAGEQPAQPAP